MGKGQGGKLEGTFTLDQPDPHQGDTVTFTLETNSDFPIIKLDGYQTVEVDGLPVQNHVYGAILNYFPSSPPSMQQAVLASDYWTEGPAHMVAELADLNEEGLKPRSLHKMEFDVAE